MSAKGFWVKTIVVLVVLFGGLACETTSPSVTPADTEEPHRGSLRKVLSAFASTRL